jgi:hypothetical protein
MRLISLATLTLLALSAAAAGHADRGVGVSLGAIEIEDRLKPGASYELPILGVLNPGDEPGDYEVVISYLDGQPQRRPAQKWFDFQPQRFRLEAGAVQNVTIRLTLPTGADPGSYYAFIQASSIVEGQGATIGAAAAARLAFEVRPATWLDAQRTKAARLLDENQTRLMLISGALLLLISTAFLRKNYRFKMPIERK